MDTRTKIISGEQAAKVAAQGGATVITGCFDPVTAEHAERLAELKGDAQTLIVIVTDPEDLILPAQARAELLAGLSVVDYVVVANVTMGGSPALTPNVRLEQEDELRRQKLVAHVHARQAAN